MKLALLLYCVPEGWLGIIPRISLKVTLHSSQVFEWVIRLVDSWLYFSTLLAFACGKEEIERTRSEIGVRLNFLIGRLSHDRIAAWGTSLSFHHGKDGCTSEQSNWKHFRGWRDCIVESDFGNWNNFTCASLLPAVFAPSLWTEQTSSKTQCRRKESQKTPPQIKIFMASSTSLAWLHELMKWWNETSSPHSHLDHVAWCLRSRF